MRLAIEISDEKIANKIIKILEVFKDEGVRVLKINQKLYKNNFKAPEELTQSWQKDIMTNENPDIDDDEILPQAYWEYKSEKYIDR